MPTIFGLPLEIALMLGAAVLYFIGIIVTWQTYRGEPNELMTAFMAFLVSMMLALSLMAMAMLWAIPLLGTLGMLAILVGSVAMLRFPISFLKPQHQSAAFSLAVAVAIILFFFMAVMPEGQRLMPLMITWFMIIVNGGVVSLSMIKVGLTASDRWLKVKTIGGGAGIASCCLASHVASLLGMISVMAVFQFLAPIIIASSVQIGKRLQKQQTMGSIPATQ